MAWRTMICKNCRQWTHFIKTFWKMSKVESKVVGKYDIERAKCETMNEEDTIYKYLAGITRIIWKL
jgi:hypothetical protein